MLSRRVEQSGKFVICGPDARISADKTEWVRAEESIGVFGEEWRNTGPASVHHVFDCEPHFADNVIRTSQ
jgi:hypothetical protein